MYDEESDTAAEDELRSKIVHSHISLEKLSLDDGTLPNYLDLFFAKIK